MGQSASSSTAAVQSGGLTRHDSFHSRRFRARPTPAIPELQRMMIGAAVPSLSDSDPDPDPDPDSDYISDLPDECLACIFHSLAPGDRKRCSLVCRRWLAVEAQSRHRLCLNAQSDLLPLIPSLFARFDSVTKLALKCDRRSASIGDDALVLVSLRCRNLTRLKLRSCRELTDAGVSALAKNCKGLRKLSCASCAFGSKGVNALLDNCASLEELSVKRLRSIADDSATEPIGPGLAASSLRIVCLKELYNGQCFGPLITGSRNLRTLKLYRCNGDWDKPLQVIGDRATGLVELHLERVQVTDAGLAAISGCKNLEVLHLVKTPECTDAGLSAVADGCNLLRKLHVDGWKANRIGDAGLTAVANCCPSLQELVLIGVNPTYRSLGMLSSSCQKLERLALCGSETVGDVEISCIAAKCFALKKLCIKSCAVSDQAMEALAGGCPNLMKVKVKKCKAVTVESVDWLRATRGSLAVNLDLGEPQNRQDVSANEIGVHENVVEVAQAGARQSATSDGLLGIMARSASFKARFGLLSGRNIVASTLRRWSGSNSGSRSN